MTGRAIPKRQRWSECVARIRTAGLIYPNTAAGISFLETGGWRPRDRMVKYNNYFAFKKNSRNLHTSLGKSQYCIYATVDASLADYRGYEQQVVRKYHLATEAAYQQHIIRTYSQDRHYARKLFRSIQTTNQF